MGRMGGGVGAGSKEGSAGGKECGTEEGARPTPNPASPSPPHLPHNLSTPASYPVPDFFTPFPHFLHTLQELATLRQARFSVRGVWLGAWVQGSGFRVERAWVEASVCMGLGFSVHGFRAQGWVYGFRAQGWVHGFRVQGLGFSVRGARVQGLGFSVHGCRLQRAWAQGSGFRVQVPKP